MRSWWVYTRRISPGANTSCTRYCFRSSSVLIPGICAGLVPYLCSIWLAPFVIDSLRHRFPASAFLASACEPAAVNRQDGTGDVVGSSRRQEHERAVEIGRSSPARRGDPGGDRLLTDGIPAQSRRVVGGHVSRGDGVHGHPRRRPLVRERPG